MKQVSLSGLLAFIAIIANAALETAHAQVTVDATKITCQQFLLMRNSEAISYWLSGYYHGKRGDPTIDTEALKSNYKRLRNECYRGAHRHSPIMQVIESSVAKR